MKINSRNRANNKANSQNLIDQKKRKKGIASN